MYVSPLFEVGLINFDLFLSRWQQTGSFEEKSWKSLRFGFIVSGFVRENEKVLGINAVSVKLGYSMALTQLNPWHIIEIKYIRFQTNPWFEPTDVY